MDDPKQVNDESAAQQSNSHAQEETVDQLKNQIKDLEQKSQEYLNGWKRAKADFINYKKDQEHTMEELAKFANLNVLLQILPVLDNYNIAEKHLPDALKNDEWVKGILHIKTQLEDIMKAQGMEEIKTVGEKFDPIVHEVIGGEEGGEVITEEIQKGYRLHGRVVRAAKVKVGK